MWSKDTETKGTVGQKSLRPTEGFGKQVLDELGMIPDMQHAVDAGVHQLLLVVMQVLGHILRHKHDVALHIHHKEEAVQGLEGREREIGDECTTFNIPAR